MKRISIVVFILAVFGACKKTKLEGDLSFFVGTWEWQYTVKTLDICNPFPYDSLITNSPSTEGYTYSLTFEEKGKLIVKKNGKKEKKYRLVYYNKEINNYESVYRFNLNNKKKKLISFILKNGVLITQAFPEDLDLKADGCQDIHSVFKKTE